MSVDGVTDRQIQNMAGDKPGNHEDYEHEVAGAGVAEVFEALGELEMGNDVSIWDARYWWQRGSRPTGRNKSTTSIRTRIRLPTRVWPYL